MVVNFFPFTMFHGKKGAGSTNIRVNQLIKYWPEADLYKYGQKADVMIYQKVYWLPDWRYQEHFDGIQILDICDPDWLEGSNVRRTIEYMDAVTCPTAELKRFLEQMTDKPVVTIPDRFDISLVPKKPKVHKGEAKKLVWFGYSHNSELLAGAVPTLQRMGLKLTVISDDDPLAWKWAESDDYKKSYSYHKYNEETIYERLAENDICILPQGNRPKDRFKSNNKTIKAFLAGLPVAKDIDSLEKYLSEDARNEAAVYNYDKAKKEYDVQESIKQYQELINKLSTA
jgi:hypothetical protein